MLDKYNLYINSFTDDINEIFDSLKNPENSRESLEYYINFLREKIKKRDFKYFESYENVILSASYICFYTNLFNQTPLCYGDLISCDKIISDILSNRDNKTGIKIITDTNTFIQNLFVENTVNTTLNTIDLNDLTSLINRFNKVGKKIMLDEFARRIKFR